MITTQIRNIGDALLQLWAEVLLYLPRIVTAAIILLIGYVIARVLRTLLTKGLRAVRFDDVADRAGVGRALQLAGIRMDAAAVLATVVFWWVFLAFIELAVDNLGLTAITAFINSLLGYLPNVFVAILILIIGALLASVVADVVRGAAGEAGLATAPLLASVARWAILIFAFLAALTQLNVAQSMIFILFAALVGMAALAGGLALGLGGVDAARSLIASASVGRLLQPGQRVQIGQQVGTIVRRDINTTVMDTGTGQVAIPNAELAHEHVTLLGSGDGRRQPAGAVPQAQPKRGVKDEQQLHGDPAGVAGPQ